MQRISVVIANYNYDRFVGAAIESALALDWADTEVVVVDDGSTDRSLEVIRGFGERIRVLATENAGQREAVNRGFALSTGEVVVFLDSDDLLPTDLARELSTIWRPGVSKAQFRMQRIDETGTAVGEPFPDYGRTPSPRDVRRWAGRTSAYPTPPGSGNAYARWFLDKVLPVGADCGDAADSALLAAAPFLGDVVTLPAVVVSYRRHGGNDSDLLRDHSRFPREVERARARWLFARRAAGDRVVDERALRSSRELLQLRAASRRLVPDAHPLPDDGVVQIVRDTLLSPFRPGPETVLRRVAIVGWCLATLAAPVGLAHRLVALRYRSQA